MSAFRIRPQSKSDVEPHEVLLDSLAERREKEWGISEKKFEVPLLKKIIQGFFIFCFLLFLILFGKTFQLQVLQGGKYQALADENKFVVQQIQAERGVIYDKNMKQLVFNRPSFDLVLDKNKLPSDPAEKGKVLKTVATIIGEDLAGLEKTIEADKDNTLLISENLSHDELILLESNINDLSGFRVNDNPIRYYQDGSAFSHLLGYTNKISSDELKANPGVYSIFDYVGRDGLEKSYEATLRKNPGELQIEKDAKGQALSQTITQSPESGKSLVLWLDADLQKKIQEELLKQFQDSGAEGAVAIAMDPKTGGILSLVSLPAFDNNLFQKGANEVALTNLLKDKSMPLFDRAIAGKYLIGSIIKPLIASAVLQEKIIDPNKKINDDKGKIIIQNPRDPSASTTKNDWAIHGLTDMRKAIAESCDVYFYTVGGGYGTQKGLGPTKMKEYLDLFGWDKKTGLDLPGEVAGFVPDKDWKKQVWKTSWWDGDTYNMAIGQGFLQITPLEVANSMAAIANGGKLLQPQAVQKIVDKNKNTVQEMSPKVILDNFIDPQNLQVVREGMRQTVTGVNSPQASAPDLNSLPVSSAAKTGTAELGNDHYNNWITVFAPYDNPQIVLTVLMENVKGVQKTVIPVAKNVLEWYFTKEGN